MKQYYKQLLDAMTEGYVVQNAQGEITDFNQSALNILGLTKEELLGRTSIDKRWKTIKENGTPFLGEEHPAMVALRTQSPQKNIVMGVHRVDGSLAWILINAIPFHINEKKQGVVATFSDITSQIGRMKQALDNENKLKEAQAVAKIGSWSFDIQSGKISWTDEMYNIFPENKKNGEPDFRRHVSTIHPEDLDIWKKTVEKCMVDGEPYLMRFRAIHPDKIVWVEARGQGICDISGKVSALRGTCQDVTDRVNLEEENSLLISSLDIGIWKWNIPENKLSWDQNMHKVYGTGPNKFDGSFEAWAKMVVPEDLEDVTNQIQKTIDTGMEFNATFRVRTDNQEIRYIGAKGVCSKDMNGKPISLSGINWNKTSEVELQKALDLEKAKVIQSSKLASLGEISAGVAHEINNPLGILSTMLELVKANAANPVKLEEKIQKMQKAILRIAKIVNGLRKFSRTSESIEKNFVSSKTLIEESLVFCEVNAKRKNVRLSVDLQTERSLVCNEIEIQQVILNLINNSIDAVENLNEKWVKVSSYDDGKYLNIRVEDSGLGIDKKIKEKIFEPFYTTKPVGKGTGLGLSISKGIIEEHGGSLSILDSVNTCFEIKLPLEYYKVRKVS